MAYICSDLNDMNLIVISNYNIFTNKTNPRIWDYIITYFKRPAVQTSTRECVFGWAFVNFKCDFEWNWFCRIDLVKIEFEEKWFTLKLGVSFSIQRKSLSLPVKPRFGGKINFEPKHPNIKIFQEAKVILSFEKGIQAYTESICVSNRN